MKLFFATIVYRIKACCTTIGSIVMLALGLLIAVSPFIGLIIPDAPIPIGWIDEDRSSFSEQLKQRVEALDVVTVFEDDEQTLIANMQTGKIEGVFVIKQGFEEAIQNGEFEETLRLLCSPYTTAAGIISESVGAQAMQLWLSHYSAREAGKLGGEALRDEVLQNAQAGAVQPIITMVRLNAAAQTKEVTPVKDAAILSIYLLASFVCFYMLAGIALMNRNTDFAARLKTRAFSLASYRAATGISDTLFILPCVLPPLIALGAANAGGLIVPMLICFLLYGLAYGGVASLVAKVNDPTVRMLTISVITIANVLFGSMLVKLPQTGVFRIFTYVLPSRWLSSVESVDALDCIAGLAVCTIVYHVLPFIFTKKEA